MTLNVNFDTRPILQLFVIEGLHDAIRTYTGTILPRCLVSFCMARYRGKQQKHAVTFDLIYNKI